MLSRNYLVDSCGPRTQMTSLMTLRVVRLGFLRVLASLFPFPYVSNHSCSSLAKSDKEATNLL